VAEAIDAFAHQTIMDVSGSPHRGVAACRRHGALQPTVEAR